METISLTKARKRLYELARRAERGETIGVTRYNKLVAIMQKRVP